MCDACDDCGEQVAFIVYPFLKTVGFDDTVAVSITMKALLGSFALPIEDIQKAAEELGYYVPEMKTVES